MSVHVEYLKLQYEREKNYQGHLNTWKEQQKLKNIIIENNSINIQKYNTQ